MASNKRAAHGSGTIRKKTVTRNGQDYTYWEARITTGYDTGTGRQKQRSVTGVVCSKRLLNQAVGKSLRTHNLKPKKGAQVMRKNEKITALYERLSRDDFGKDDDQQRESNSISNQELLCRGWFLPPNTYDCGSFVVNGTAVVGKEQNIPYNC